MLTIFNRTEVFITYDKENMEKACAALARHNIDYTLKTTKMADAYAKDAQELDVAYKLYVRKDEAEEAQSWIHKVLFVDE